MSYKRQLRNVLQSGIVFSRKPFISSIRFNSTTPEIYKKVSPAEIERLIIKNDEGDKNCDKLLTTLKNIPGKDLKEFLSSSYETFPKDGYELLQDEIKRVIISDIVKDPKGVVNLINYINYKTSTLDTDFFDRLTKTLKNDLLKDDVKIRLLHFILNEPLSPGVIKRFYDRLKEFLRNKKYNLDNEQKLGLITSIFEKISQIENQIIKLNIIKTFDNYFSEMKSSNIKADIKYEDFSQELFEQFQKNSKVFFNEFKLPLSPSFFNEFMKSNLFTKREYPLLLKLLLDCNVECRLHAFKDHDQVYYNFIKYLNNQSSQENSDLVATINWNNQLQKLIFRDEDFEVIRLNYKNDIKNFIFNHKNELNEIYFENKIYNFYTLDVLPSIILNHTKKKDKLADSVTSRIIDLIGINGNISELKNNQSIQTNLNYLKYFDNVSKQKDAAIRRLVKILELKFDELIGNLQSFESSRTMTTSLTSLIKVLLQYLLNYSDPASIIDLVKRTQNLNHKFINKTNKIIISNDHLMVLILTHFRQKGKLDEALGIIKYLIDKNIEDKSFRNPNFKYKSTIAKDLITEFLLILKETYKNEPKIFFSYFLELTTLSNEIYNYYGITDKKMILTNEQFLEYFKNHSNLGENRNYISGFSIMNKLGLLKLIYEPNSNIDSIDLENSQIFDFYSKKLLRSTKIRPELRNSKISIASLSIAYSIIFKHLENQDSLNEKNLLKLYDNYLNLIVELQNISELPNSHPFSSEKLNDFLTLQFMSIARKLNLSPDIILKILLNFLNKTKHKNENISMKTFEYLIFYYSLKHYHNNVNKRSSIEYNETILNIINLMTEKFEYNLGFWSKMSMILINLNEQSATSLNKDDVLTITNEKAYQWFLKLTNNNQNFSEVRHILLINIANDNNWSLPNHLNFKNFQKSILQNTKTQVSSSDFDSDDLKEFDNDKLDGWYDDAMDTKINGNMLKVENSMDEEEFFYQVFELLKKATSKEKEQIKDF